MTSPQPPRADAEPLDIDAYHNAAGGDTSSPLWDEWRDKPHRLVYDLCSEVRRLRRQLEEARAALQGVMSDIVPEYLQDHPGSYRALGDARKVLDAARSR